MYISQTIIINCTIIVPIVPLSYQYYQLPYQYYNTTIVLTNSTIAMMKRKKQATAQIPMITALVVGSKGPSSAIEMDT